MPKLKPCKAGTKRYKAIGKKNFKRRHAFKGHLLTKKSSSRKTRLAKICLVKKTEIRAIRKMLIC